MKKICVIVILLVCSVNLSSQIPNNYYSSANNKSGSTLKTALSSCIVNHTELSYISLWTAFLTTDVHNDIIWDMYSDSSAYKPGGSKQGASYSGELDSYNREHSFPKSWFNNATPMYTDLHHIVPTDGYINGRRSNYPYGETSNPTYKSLKGFSKLGPCNKDIGYSGTVFEPNDIYKGDFARIYFYMLTCYENQISNWSSPMLDGNKYPGFSTWALNMLLRWAKEDPVSQKEIDRNNAVYKIQGNRNPYIDYEGLEQYVWGDLKNVSVDLNNYTSPYGDIPGSTLSSPVFSVSSGQVDSATNVILTGPNGATIYYSFDNGETWSSGTPPITFVITESTTILAYATDGTAKSSTTSVSYTVGNNSNISSSLYEKVISNDQLVSGKKYIISVPTRTVCMAERENNDFKTVTTSFDGQYIDVSQMGGVCTLKLEETSNGWALKSTSTGQYLAWESGNSLTTNSTSSSKNACWNISANFESTAITNAANSQRKLQYNAANNVQCFRCYTSSQTAIQLYVQVNSDNDNPVSDTIVAAPTLSYPSEKPTPNSEFTLSCATEGATIYYSFNGREYVSGNSPCSFTIDNIGTYNIKAYSVLNSHKSDVCDWDIDIYPSAPSFSLAGGTYPTGTTISITASEEVNIYYTLDGTTPSEDSFGYTDAIVLQPGTTTITAIAERDGFESDEVTATYIITDEDDITSDVLYKKITSKDELVSGSKYLIVYETDNITMGDIAGTGTNTYFNSCVANISGNIIEEVNTDATIVTLAGKMDEWILIISNGYMACQRDANYIQVQNEIDNSAQWAITFDESGNALIKSNYSGQNDRWIQYNSASNSLRFSTYKGTQKDIQLYKEIKKEPTGIANNAIISAKTNHIYFDLQGRRVYKPTKGIYIVNGKKVFIK